MATNVSQDPCCGDASCEADITGASCKQCSGGRAAAAEAQIRGQSVGKPEANQAFGMFRNFVRSSGLHA